MITAVEFSITGGPEPSFQQAHDTQLFWNKVSDVIALQNGYFDLISGVSTSATCAKISDITNRWGRLLAQSQLEACCRMSMFASASLPPVGLSRDGAQTRYSFRDTSHTKHPDYLYLSDNATAPSSGELSDKQPTLTQVTVAAGNRQPKRNIEQEDLLHPEQFAPSQLSGASQIAAHPLNDGYDFPASQECSQTYGKPKKKVNHPLKYEEFADSPNINEAEKRKLRRRTANRESARRVRDRRTKHSGKLEAKVSLHHHLLNKLNTRCVTPFSHIFFGCHPTRLFIFSLYISFFLAHKPS